jgi:site-specific DNA recombinase
VPRDRSEWIGIKIPAIISKELSDRVRARIAYNRNSYRNAKRKQLLSRLVECGECGSGFYSHQRYYTKTLVDGSLRIHHKVAYKCNWQASHKMHTDERAERCHNPEVSAAVLEPFVFSLIRDIMLDPRRIRDSMDLFAQEARTSKRRIERQIEDINSRLRTIEREKKRIVDIYASGDLSREAYVRKNLASDAETVELRMQAARLHDRIPLLRKRSVVQESIITFCEGAKARLNTCTDFDNKRQFLLDYIDKVVYRAAPYRCMGRYPLSSRPMNIRTSWMKYPALNSA